jgi:hypothetical protein
VLDRDMLKDQEAHGSEVRNQRSEVSRYHIF